MGSNTITGASGLHADGEKGRGGESRLFVDAVAFAFELDRVRAYDSLPTNRQIIPNTPYNIF